MDDMQTRKALESIAHAFHTSLIQAGFTLIVVIICTLGLIQCASYSLLNLLDVVLILGLGFGTKRKSRVCATLLFVYQACNLILSCTSGRGGAIGIIALMFAYGYFKGMMGTFVYRRRKRALAKGTQLCTPPPPHSPPAQGGVEC